MSPSFGVLMTDINGHECILIQQRYSFTGRRPFFKIMGVLSFFTLEQEKQHLQDRISRHGKFRKAVLHPPPAPGFLRPPRDKCFLVPNPAGLRSHLAFQEQEFKTVCSSQISNPLAALDAFRISLGTWDDA